jgi:hypothetical protein
VEVGHLLLGIERQPRCSRVAVAWLPDAARVYEPAAAAEVESGAVACLGAMHALLRAGWKAREEQSHVRVADQPNPLRLGIQARVGLLAGEHVLPDGVARGGMEEPNAFAL